MIEETLRRQYVGPLEMVRAKAIAARAEIVDALIDIAYHPGGANERLERARVFLSEAIQILRLESEASE
jgi:hypothetical protein